MKDTLKTIAKLLSKKSDYSLVLSGNKSDFTTSLYPPLQFESKKWVVGLLNIDTAYSFPNITTNNNIFTYSIDSGATWKTITLPVGCYEITAINDTIKSLMLTNGDSGIDIQANRITLGCDVRITPATYQVDFTVANSIAPTLGFNSQILSTGSNSSQNIAKVSSVNSVIVNCSIIGNSYLKGSNFPVLYSFSPNVSPGRKISKEPKNVVYLPLTTDYIPTIRIWLTDQDGNILDFRGEEITCRLNFRYL